MYGLRQPHLEDYARDCMDQLHIDYLSSRSYPISINAGNTSQLGPVCSILHYLQGSYVTLHSTVLSSTPAARVSLELSFTWTVNHPICGDMVPLHS